MGSWARGWAGDRCGGRVSVRARCPQEFIHIYHEVHAFTLPGGGTSRPMWGHDSPTGGPEMLLRRAGMGGTGMRCHEAPSVSRQPLSALRLREGAPECPPRSIRITQLTLKSPLISIVHTSKPSPRPPSNPLPRASWRAASPWKPLRCLAERPSGSPRQGNGCQSCPGPRTPRQSRS